MKAPQTSGSTTHIIAHQSLNGIQFGSTEDDLFEVLGPPDKAQKNYTGEAEYLYANEIYRCMSGRLVECTIPDTGRFTVDGMEILSIFEWLAACGDTVDRAKFRISTAYGIAYDWRDPDNGSITIFTKGRWDALISG